MKKGTKKGRAVVNSSSLTSWSRAEHTNLVKDTEPYRPKGQAKKTKKHTKMQTLRHNTHAVPETDVRN